MKVLTGGRPLDPVGRVPCQREDGVGVDGRALDAAGVAELAAELGRAALGE